MLLMLVLTAAGHKVLSNTNNTICCCSTTACGILDALELILQLNGYCCDRCGSLLLQVVRQLRLILLQLSTRDITHSTGLLKPATP